MVNLLKQTPSVKKISQQKCIIIFGSFLQVKALKSTHLTTVQEDSQKLQLLIIIVIIIIIKNKENIHFYSLLVW